MQHHIKYLERILEEKKGYRLTVGFQNYHDLMTGKENEMAIERVISLIKERNKEDYLPELEECKEAANNYATKKGGSEFGLVFRAFQEGINWALNKQTTTP